MTLRHDLTARQGETWAFVYTHKPGGALANLTGFTARMAIKAAYSDSAQAYLSTGSDAIGGTITLGGALGTVTLGMTGDQTDNLNNALVLTTEPDDVSMLLFRYDLELVSAAGVVTRALEGRFTLIKGITR